MRREQFAGVGSEQNFSQTNSKETSVSAKTQDSSKARFKTKLIDIKKPISARYLIHAAVFVAVLAFVSVGRINASQALNTQGDGSTKDQTSMIATGAMLANSTQSLVANDISQKAQDLTNMSSLATAGDDFLAKRSPVMTAGTNRDITTYKVKDGDTLASLSQKFNVTTDTIKWANNIADENQIKPGADLTILPVSGVLYIAKDGDDLLAIAQQYQSNAALIENFNQLEGKGPTGGMKLVIPDGVMPAPAATVASTATVGTSSSYNGFFSTAKFTSGGNTYTSGQCTWYVASRRSVPGNWGNAYNWYYNAQRSGFGTGSTPRAGAIGWERKNHVVYVESVNGDGTVTISEMNWGGRPGVVHYRTTPASQFLYIY